MSGSPKLIESPNLSVAWGQALLQVLNQPLGKCNPLVVSICGFTNSVPPEDDAIRSEVDKALKLAGCNSCDVSAMVIFPYKLWLRRPNSSCEDFCNTCIQDLFPRLAALDTRNRHGTYFTRMMAYDGNKKGTPVVVNQIAELVDRLSGDRRFRATGLQMTCFNPATDHSRQPVLGFPCLQHVGVTYEEPDGIAITGSYPSQYIFDRGYGNYLGLGHLGHFLAYHSGLSLRRVTCIATRPLLGKSTTKLALRGLKSLLEKRLEAENGDE